MYMRYDWSRSFLRRIENLKVEKDDFKLITDMLKYIFRH